MAAVADRHIASQQVAGLLFLGGGGEQADAGRLFFAAEARRLVLAEFPGDELGFVGAAASMQSGGLEPSVKADVPAVAPQSGRNGAGGVSQCAAGAFAGTSIATGKADTKQRRPW